MDNVVPFPGLGAPRPGADIAEHALLASDDDAARALARLADAKAIVEQRQLKDMAERILGPSSDGGPRAA